MAERTMTHRIAPFLVAAVVLGAGGVALFRGEDTRAASSSLPEAPTSTQQETTEPVRLPPNHPPIDQAPSPHGGVAPPGDETAALIWETPHGWQAVPNPNAMRIATYRPLADSSDAPEISVARAGGTTEANIQRWLAQFDDTGADKRTETKVHGLDVTVVEVSGTYMGGSMMSGAQASSHAGWTLVGAVVPTAGSTYFFKLLGPTAKVRAARASFDALVGSISPR
jgi:hypothetical protein